MAQRGPDPSPTSSRSATTELSEGLATGEWALELGSPLGTQSIALERETPLVIGSGRDADVRLSDPAVSSRHVSVALSGRTVRVDDLGSKNGLFVGGARIPGAWLSSAQCTFVIGRSTVTLRPVSEVERSAPRNVERVAGLIGEAAPMRRLTHEIRRAARLRAPVHLVGESGSGKDVVARAIHDLGSRPGPFVPLNVGAITEALADAELFGHRRGAFTGAVASRLGAFEAAHQGTLFLDEIGDLPASIQVKLLRVVEDGDVRPVGAVEPTRVDVRLVSATWASLEERVEAGCFRQDLFHRVTTLTIRVPPLRQRKSDLPALCRAFLAQMRDEVGRRALSSAAAARLATHTWPGNVRELRTVLYRAALSARDDVIDARHVDAALPKPRPRRRSSPSRGRAQALLDAHGGNVSAAARAAGVPRSTFRSWLERDG